MEITHVDRIANLLSLSAKQVFNTVKLFEEGATIPFIARYRKEATGGLDEVLIAQIKQQLKKLEELDKRRQSIIESISEQGKMTDELMAKLVKADILALLEDIYLPYKPKRKTRATVAREKGLEPLAQIIFSQTDADLRSLSTKYINDKVASADEAIAGAKDIIAEWISEDQVARGRIRSLFRREAEIMVKVQKGKEEEGQKFRDYYKHRENLMKCPSHRFLAIMRGENEGILTAAVEPDEDNACDLLKKMFVKAKNASARLVAEASDDSYKRLIRPSMETEFRNLKKEEADADAIRVFAQNLRQLLLEPPLGQKRILAIDPGYRTGCKVVCLDEQGKLLHHEEIFPHEPHKREAEAEERLKFMVDKFAAEYIGIGNGTAGRETEQFVRSINFDRKLSICFVDEDGASVYSASENGREEFPDHDVTVRGAISIGRRLLDPLAELVKIDPKSIGVGQYQHDVDQHLLQEGLDAVVESCVNYVGVELNTASKHLLTYVSGLGPQLAQNIVDHRAKEGTFKSREELKKIKRLGDKAFELSAGFLRIRNAKNPLDNTAVHPESYFIVEKMAADLGVSIAQLISNKDLRDKIKIENYVNDKFGIPTLKDILQELDKPGRDPREQKKAFAYAENIFMMEDLQAGMIIPGIITNVTNFGCFVDIGVKQDGLVHISELTSKYIRHPDEVIKLHQHVKVKVVNLDFARKRIGLSMKNVEQGE